MCVRSLPSILGAPNQKQSYIYEQIMWKSDTPNWYHVHKTRVYFPGLYSYGYKNPLYKPKTVWQPSQVYNGNFYNMETVLLIEYRPGEVLYIGLAVNVSVVLQDIHNKSPIHQWSLMHFVIV